MSLFARFKNKENRSLKKDPFSERRDSDPSPPTVTAQQHAVATTSPTTTPTAEVKNPKDLLPFDKPSPWMTGGISSGYKKPESKPTSPQNEPDLASSPTDESLGSQSEKSDGPSSPPLNPQDSLPFRQNPSPWMKQGGIGKFGSSNTPNTSPAKPPQTQTSPDTLSSSSITTTTTTSGHEQSEASTAQLSTSPLSHERSTSSLTQASLGKQDAAKRQPTPTTRTHSKGSNLTGMKKGSSAKQEVKVDKCKRIVVLGCRNVGKTALTFRFIHNEFYYFDELRMKRSTSESDLKRISSLDELSSEKKKYNLETDANEVKEQKELQESFGVKPTTPPTVPTTIVPTIETKSIHEDKQIIVAQTVVTEESPSTQVQIQQDTAVASNETEEIQRLQKLILHLTQELNNSNKERDELRTMWKNERNEKLQLEEEYYRMEQELNNMKNIHFKISELIRTGNNYDPSTLTSTTATLGKLDTGTNKTVTPISVSTSTPGSSLTGTSPGILSPTSKVSTPFSPHRINQLNGVPSPRNSSTPTKMIRQIPAHTRRASMQIVAGSFQEEDLQSEIRRYEIDATEPEKPLSRSEQLDQQAEEEFAKDVAKHREDEVAEMNDILLDFDGEEQAKKASTPAQETVVRSMSDMNTETSDIADGTTETDETYSETEFDDDTSQSSGDRSLTPTAAVGLSLEESDVMDRRRSQSLTQPRLTSSGSGKNKKQLEMKTPVKSILFKQGSSGVIPHNQSLSTNTPPGTSTPTKTLNQMFHESLSPAFILMEGVRRFNKTENKPQEGIKYLQSMYILPEGPFDDDLVAKSIARFLVQCDNLGKAQVGVMLGNHIHAKILKEYVDLLFSNLYKDQKFDFVLRHFLLLFKLPVEGQQVMRICEEFAVAYVKHNPNGPLKDPESTFLLVCTLLMVNQEQHNPKATTKMSRQQFLDIFKATDISSTFLTDMYDSIKKRAMILVDADDLQDDEVSSSEEEAELLINDETIEQYLLMENRRRPSGEIVVGEDRTTKRPITFLYKTRIIVRNRLRRFIIKDSDPVLNLVNDRLEPNPFLEREISRGNFFIVVYSVSDKNSFRAAQVVIDRILEAKKQHNTNNNKKLKKKTSTLTKGQTQSITDMINEELEEELENEKNYELLVLVGCKADEIHRQVTYRQGVDYALEKTIPFYEISALENSKQKIRGLFMTAFETILKAERSKRDDFKNKDKITISKSLNIDELLSLPYCYID